MLIIFGSLADNFGNPHHLGIAIYYIYQRNSNLLFQAMGIQRGKKPFHPTWPSTKERMKIQCQVRGPKETVSVVSSKAGGSCGARTPGELPRNEQQVCKTYN